MLKHEVKEESHLVKKSDWYCGVIGEYRVLVIRSNDVTRISVSPVKWDDGARLGIFDCHPKSVAELEKFADDADELFRALAAELRASGLEDLRSKWDIMKDESDAGFAQRLAVIQKEAGEDG